MLHITVLGSHGMWSCALVWDVARATVETIKQCLCVCHAHALFVAMTGRRGQHASVISAECWASLPCRRTSLTGGKVYVEWLIWD